MIDDLTDLLLVWQQDCQAIPPMCELSVDLAAAAIEVGKLMLVLDGDLSRCIDERDGK